MNTKWLRWVPVLLWCILIFSLTSSPIATAPSTESVIRSATAMPVAQARSLNAILRKQAHVIEFAILALLTRWAIGARPWGDVAAWSFAALYAASDEYHQLLVLGRSGSFDDVVLDAFGAFVALVLCRLVIGMFARRGDKGSAL